MKHNMLCPCENYDVCKKCDYNINIIPNINKSKHIGIIIGKKNHDQRCHALDLPDELLKDARRDIH